MLVSACGFGSGALFAKPVYAEGVGWHVLLAWRFLVGAALAWAFLLWSPSRRRGLLALDRRAVVVALALGVLYVGNSGTYYAGLESVDASLAALIVYIYPALVAVLSLRIGRPLEGARVWVALGLALAGVALGINATNAPPVGALLLVVASPVIYAVWIVLAARLSGERRSEPDDGEPNGTAGAAARAATALMMTATALVYWVTALAAGQPVGPGSIPAAAWPGVLAIGAVATFLAIQGFYAGAQRVGAAQAALLSTIEPLWTIGLAALLLHETLSPIQLAGGALILVGVIVAQTGPASVRSARPAVRLADE